MAELAGAFWRLLAVATAGLSVGVVALVPPVQAASGVRGKYATYPLPADETPVQMTADGLGLVFVTSGGQVGYVGDDGSVTVSSERVPEVGAVPAPAELVGPSSAGLWAYSNRYQGQCSVYLITPSHVMTRTLRHPLTSRCDGAAIDPSGDLWVVASGHGFARLVEITPRGVVSQVRPGAIEGQGGPVVVTPSGGIVWIDAKRGHRGTILVTQAPGGAASGREIIAGRVTDGGSCGNPGDTYISDGQLLNGPDGGVYVAPFPQHSDSHGIAYVSATGESWVCRSQEVVSPAVTTPDGSIWYVGEDEQPSGRTGDRWVQERPGQPAVGRSSALPAGFVSIVAATRDGKLWAVVLGAQPELVSYLPTRD